MARIEGQDEITFTLSAPILLYSSVPFTKNRRRSLRIDEGLASSKNNGNAEKITFS